MADMYTTELREAPTFVKVFGAVCIGGALLMGARDSLIVVRGDAAEATVVDFTTPEDPAGVPCPILEFVDASGMTQRATSRTCSSPSDLSKGDTAQVHYDPDEPDAIVVGSLVGALGLYLGVLAGGFLLLGIGFALAGIRKPQSS